MALPAAKTSLLPHKSSGVRGLGEAHLHVEVELELFEGRPNPRWLLGRATAEALLAKLKSGGPIAATVTPLGYRGFIVRIQSGTEKRVVQVHHDAALERWLLDTGRFCMPSEMAAFVERQLR
jgi:hypothetical protein